MLTEEQKHKISELYPEHSAKEIGEVLGINRNRINDYARKNGIRHTPEAWQRIKRCRVIDALRGHTKESYLKGAATRKRTYRSEMLRLLGGQRKETRITVSVLSQKCRRRMIMLCNQHNYFRDEDINEAVVYYDSETKRCPAAERYASEKYGIKFVEADE